MPSTEHVVETQPAIRRHVPTPPLSLSSVPLVRRSDSRPECDRRSLLVDRSAAPPPDFRTSPVVPPRDPSPHRRRLSLWPCRGHAHPQPSVAHGRRIDGGNAAPPQSGIADLFS